MASWMRPQNYEQFDIDHYNLNVSSTSGIQQVSLQENGDSTSAVLTVSENPNNVQLNTTFTVTITATSQCGETSSAATANYTLSELLHLMHVAIQFYYQISSAIYSYLMRVWIDVTQYLIMNRTFNWHSQFVENKYR